MTTRSLRKERIGVVSSDKMEKSVVVSEVKKVKHPVYGKFVLKLHLIVNLKLYAAMIIEVLKE